jgi:hypothetical protein
MFFSINVAEHIDQVLLVGFPSANVLAPLSLISLTLEKLLSRRRTLPS